MILHIALSGLDLLKRVPYFGITINRATAHKPRQAG